MRISTQQMFDSNIGSIQQQTNDVMKNQVQISSGKKYQNASDNVQAVGYGLKLEFDLAQFDMFSVNQKKMIERIDNADAQLRSINSALIKFKQLVVQAGSSLSQSSLSTSIYQEADSLRKSIQSFAEAEDASGKRILLNQPTNTLGKVTIDSTIFVDEGISYSEAMGLDVAGPPKKYDTLTLLGEIVTNFSTNTAPTSDDLINLDKAIDQVRASQVKVGIMYSQVNNAQDSVDLKKVNVDNARSVFLDTDIAEASANLAKSQALLQAAQLIFAKMQSSTLFDKI
jgi:flagellin-like hook-associated protein FlgL